MRTWWGLTLLTALAVGAMGSAQQDPPKETEKPKEEPAPTVVGTWRILSAQQDGKALPQEKLGGSLAIEEKRFSLGFSGGDVNGTYLLNVNQTPKGIDITRSDDANKGKIQRGIYEVTADELKLCLAPAGSRDRPLKFEARAGSGATVLVFKRTKLRPE